MVVHSFASPRTTIARTGLQLSAAVVSAAFLGIATLAMPLAAGAVPLTAATASPVVHPAGSTASGGACGTTTTTCSLTLAIGALPGKHGPPGEIINQCWLWGPSPGGQVLCCPYTPIWGGAGGYVSAGPCTLYNLNSAFAHSSGPVGVGGARPHYGADSTLNLTGSATGYTQTNDSVTIYGTNGTYAYMVYGATGFVVSGLSPSGNVTVSGSNVTLDIAFAKGKTGSLVYREKGLTPGTTWCPLFVGCTTKASVRLAGLTPGTYLYGVAPVAGYAEGPPAGTVTTTMGATTILVRFVPILYTVTFNETGLAAGVTWHLRLTCSSSTTNTSGCHGMKASGSDQATSGGGNLTLMLRNGTYAWKFVPVKDYELEVNGTVDPTWSGTIAVAASGAGSAPAVHYRLIYRP
jgi:hypothetical protein